MKSINPSANFSSNIVGLNSSSQKNDGSVTIAAEYRLRLQSLDTIKLLVHLCRDIQKHRGLSMALLGGGEEFASRFGVLQKQIARRIEVLNDYCGLPDSQLSANNRQRIDDAWKTVKEGWHDDSVLENFQFHNYFIEQLLQMITQLLSCLYLTQAKNADKCSSTLHDIVDNAQYKNALINFTVCRMPSLIETLGMIRALTTHSASQGFHNIEHDKKLAYLCQCLLEDKRAMIDIADELYDQLGVDIPSLLVLKTYDFKTNSFLEKVKKKVVGQDSITMSSEELFATATDIMEVYWRIVDDGMAVIYRYQDEALETWFSGD